jgi:hypothetical protein
MAYLFNGIVAVVEDLLSCNAAIEEVDLGLVDPEGAFVLASSLD